MVFANVNCGDLSGRKYSDKLKGALSANQDFFFINTIVDGCVGVDYVNDGLFLQMSVKRFIPEGINVDLENDIFTSDAGAIVDAYDFNGLRENEKELFGNAIIMQYKCIYPDYDFRIMPGQFPLGVNGSITVNKKVKRKEEAVMSSHILYITNYKEFINDKFVQKVK